MQHSIPSNHSTVNQVQSSTHSEPHVESVEFLLRNSLQPPCRAPVVGVIHVFHVNSACAFLPSRMGCDSEERDVVGDAYR